MDKSIDIILNGGVVILPTETVYGLCCLANNTLLGTMQKSESPRRLCLVR